MNRIRPVLGAGTTPPDEQVEAVGATIDPDLFLPSIH